MLIDCPACARSYHVSRAEIGEEGRTVVCPRCDARWFVDHEGIGTLIQPGQMTATAFSRRGRTIEHETAARGATSLWRRLLPAAAVALCLASAMVVLGARERIVGLVPRTAGLYAAIHLPVNLRGLEIMALAPERNADAPSDVTISGEIRNVAAKRVGIPRLTYQVRDAAGTMLASWTERAGAKTLGTGKTLPFVSSPHPLPPEARSVLVRFEIEDDTAPPLHIARHAVD